MPIYYVGSMPYSSSLSHFGIKGQKWGIRRYQNPDGTLTPAGKARYTNNPDQLMKDYRKDWSHTYNRAAERSWTEFSKVNEKFKDVDTSSYDTKDGQRYVKAIDKAWRNVYMSELRRDYGEASRISGLGEDWMKNAPFMDSYSGLIKKK